MTNQGNPGLCEETGPRQAAHHPKHRQLHITEDFTSDEKSQIQALDRTQKTLPMKPGLAERRTHDYIRHGTTTLFAALEIATGRVTGITQPRHRRQEFLRFLKHVAKAYPDQELGDNPRPDLLPKPATNTRRKTRTTSHDNTLLKLRCCIDPLNSSPTQSPQFLDANQTPSDVYNQKLATFTYAAASTNPTGWHQP